VADKGLKIKARTVIDDDKNHMRTMFGLRKPHSSYKSSLSCLPFAHRALPYARVMTLPSLGASTVSRDERRTNRVSILRLSLYSPLRHARACLILSRAKHLVRRASSQRSDLACVRAFRQTPIAEPQREARPRTLRSAASPSRFLVGPLALLVSSHAAAYSSSRK